MPALRAKRHLAAKNGRKLRRLPFAGLFGTGFALTGITINKSICKQQEHGYAVMPAWNPRNLNNHHRERLRKDPGCLEDLLGIPGTITVAQYEAVSHQVVRDAWAEFEAEKRDARNGGYHNATAYFVDDNLITAITDLPHDWFITCFHEHFDKPHGVEPAAGVSSGQKKLIYKQRLDDAEAFKKYINVRRKKGV